MTKAPIHCVKPDTGAGMATVIFSLFSNAHYFDSVICQKKLSMPRMAFDIVFIFRCSVFAKTSW